MNIEGGVSISAPSIGPAISGPALGPSIGPSFAVVNEGPAPIGSFDNFSPLMPSTPDLGGTFGPVDALNSTFPIFEPQQPMGNIFNEGSAPAKFDMAPAVFLENTRPLLPADFSYTPKSIRIIENPFRPSYSDPGSEIRPLEWIMPHTVEPAPFYIPIGVAIPLVEDEEETEAELGRVRQTIKKLTNKVIEDNEVNSAVTVEPSTAIQQAVKQQKMILTMIEDKKEARSTSPAKNRMEVSKRKIVKDLNALAKRLSDASVAIMRAFKSIKPDKKTGKKMVGGEDVEKQIPNEYSGVRSQALKEDVGDSVPDGTYLLGKIAIIKIEKTDSPEKMQSEVVQVWNANYTVEKSRNGEGEKASQKQVDDTYMYVPGSPLLSQTLVKEAA